MFRWLLINSGKQDCSCICQSQLQLLCVLVYSGRINKTTSKALGIPFFWQCLLRNSMVSNLTQFHPVHVMGTHTCFPVKTLLHWALPHQTLLFSQGTNQHLIKLTDSQQMVPLQELWKVLVLMVALRLQGGGGKTTIHTWILDQWPCLHRWQIVYKGSSETTCLIDYVAVVRHIQF